MCAVIYLVHTPTEFYIYDCIYNAHTRGLIRSCARGLWLSAVLCDAVRGSGGAMYDYIKKLSPRS